MPHSTALSYISPKAVVRNSPIHGRGLFAAKDFRAEDIVCVKGGYIFSRSTLRKIQPIVGPAEIQIADDLFIGPLHTDEKETGMIFTNHSCDPNIAVKGQIIFVAIRDIATGEELTHDWATTDDDEYVIECRCGSWRCRGLITGKDWQKKELQERYRGMFSWYLQAKIESICHVTEVRD